MDVAVEADSEPTSDVDATTDAVADAGASDAEAADTSVCRPWEAACPCDEPGEWCCEMFPISEVYLCDIVGGTDDSPVTEWQHYVATSCSEEFWDSGEGLCPWMR